MLQLRIRAIQTFDEPCIDTHSTSFRRVCREPMGGTAAGSAAMEFDPVFVPGVCSRRAHPLCERDLVERIVRP